MNFEDRYGFLDRLLHRIAFRVPVSQRAMADVEETLYGDVLRSISVDDPVFISALPRSGTTILLKILADTDHFASHTYRDMPFVLSPMLWSRFSRRFAVDDVPKERAHDDGLMVSADSPEAFEEMIWKAFWPEHYRSDRIPPWTEGETSPEFDAFLETHMRKIVALRRRGDGDHRRYVSKNNNNIARLGALPGPMERGVFLVPFREPVQQAASMLKQHRRFLEIHRRDDFVREYMEAIGHHEFGKGLKPVDFGGWLEAGANPEELEFWVRYWLAAYRHVHANADSSTRIVSYARLTAEPEAALGRLADAVGVPGSSLVPMAHRLRPPRHHEVDPSGVPRGIADEAEELFERLREVAVV